MFMKLLKMLTTPIKALTIAVVAMSAGARDWYIDPEKGNDVTGDGTAGSPFLTINRASTNAAFTAGETIYLAPGDYKVGSVEEWVSQKNVEGIFPSLSRVVLPKSAVLESTLGEAGRDVTRIFGRSVDDPNGLDGCGNGAIRCIYAKGKNTHVRNVTLIDGCTTWTNGNGSADFMPQQGGAIRCDSSSVYLVNCVVTNCAGRGGAIHNAMAIRCRVLGCGGQSTLRTGNAYFSFFDGNKAAGAVISYSSVVNCTLVNSASLQYQGTVYAANTIHALNSGTLGLPAASGTNNYTVSLAGFSVLQNPFFNVFHGDYRLREADSCLLYSSTSSSNQKPLENLADKGDWKLLTAKFTVPDEYAYTGERLHLGCFGTAAQSGAGIYVGDKSFINGVKPPLTESKSMYVGFPTNYPTFYKVLPDADHPEWAYYNMWRPSNCGGNLYLEPDGSGCILPPPDTNMMMQVARQAVTETLYVDGENPDASDDNPGTEALPFKTIQAAADAVSTDRPLILVKPGTYMGAHEYKVTNKENTFTLRAAVVLTNHACVVRSTGGAAVTFIKGAPDPDTKGLGPKAVRCLHASSWSGSGQVAGFTLTDGYSDESTANLVCRYGAVAYGEGVSKFTLADCVVTNCHGGDNLIRGVFVKRSRIVGNDSETTLFDNSYASACVFAGNRAETCLLGGDGAIFGSTLFGNACPAIATSANARFFNCLLDGNGARGTAFTDRGGNFAWNFTDADALPAGIVRKDAFLVDPAHGDFRLSKASPAIDAGATAAEITTAIAPYVSTTDLAYAMPRVTDGVLTPGARQDDFVPSVCIVCPNGGLAIAGGQAGVNPLTGEEAITITASGTGTRPCVGYTVNGVTNLFANVPSKTITAADLAAADGKITVDAIYTSDWYVDDDNGNDGNSGFTPETPFKTLAAALTNALLKAGDTVHAAPGVYREGTIVTPVANSTVTPSRAAVPSGVTLEGADPETTVILGGEQIHCVALPAGARVRNFTLTGAKLARVNNGAGTDYPGESDTGAAAVLGADEATSVAENCIISNNVAYRRAAGLRCTFVRCRILNNLSDTAPAGCYATYHHCLIDGNRGEYIAMYSSYYNTTFTPDNLLINGGVTSLAYYFSQVNNYHCWENGFRALNSVFPGRVCTNHCYRYCALCSDVKSHNGPYIDAEVAGEGSILTNKAAYTFDEKGFPTRSNPIIDASNLAWVRESMKAGDTLDSDLSGGQRVYNGTLDIGCYEYDWRGDYAKDLSSKRGLQVTAAGANVVETEEKAVRVSADNDLTALWTSREPVLRDYEMKAQVSGAGTLTVKLNGIVLATVTAADELKTLAFKNDLTANTVEFTFAGEGYADLSGFTRTGNGILLLVR